MKPHVQEVVVKRDQDELDTEREIVLLLQNHIRMLFSASAAGRSAQYTSSQHQGAGGRVFDVEENPTFVFAAAARRLKPSPRMQWKRSAARVPQCYRNWQGARRAERREPADERGL
ncbi:unnamed protein product [Arctogadus glacialis]